VSEANQRSRNVLFFSREMYIAALCVFTIAWHLIARYALHVSANAAARPLIVALVVGGAPLLITLISGALAGQFGSDLLAGISIVTSAILGEYLAGCVIVLMLSGGNALEQFATRRASAVLRALANRMPLVAHRKTGSQITDIGLDQIRVGDSLIVLPHERCPVDGNVAEGQGVMDESYLTGEPWQISKVPGSAVLSGAINGATALTICAALLPVDSRYQKIVRVMERAELSRPRFRRIGDRLGAWYTVLALLIAIAGWIAGHSPTRFLAVLVIATPCPLLLAIPIAIIGAISVAASRAIIVKDPAMLERIDSCRTIIFDKTGTLTYGKPTLAKVLFAPGSSREEAISMAASIEQYSKHPLAGAVLEAARVEQVSLLPVTTISEKPGGGLTGNIRDHALHITGRRQVIERLPCEAPLLPPVAPGLEAILLVDGKYTAAFQFRDAPRAEGGAFVRHLAPRHGVTRAMILSGDRESEVLCLAGEVGIAEALFGKSPEEKLAIVREEAKRTPTMFVGDGINDAPAMQAATVGIAFGQNSDIAAEAADAVILDPSFRKVDELIHIGRRMKRIALQSALGGITLSLIGMFAAAAGYLPPVAGAIAQEFVDVAAVINALRVALPSKELASDNL
jgi:heavy metal translocating P-type ATPase